MQETLFNAVRKFGRAKVFPRHINQSFNAELCEMKFAALSVPLVAALMSVGCSTITQSETQSLALTATYQDKPIDAECRLANDKGSWDAKAPSSVSVRKSGEDLDVTCKKDGMPDGILKAISRAAGSMFGNIIFGGGIGALIDHNKGTGYDYPNRLPVKMGESVVVDKKAETQQTQTTSQNLAEDQNRAASRTADAADRGSAYEPPTWAQVQVRR